MSKKHQSDVEQSRLFEETARKIGADEENSAADLLMGRLARTPPDPKAAKMPKAKRGSGK